MSRSSSLYPISIDGSHGEGGGQILRTSLALSCVLGKPISVINIRRLRRKTGLQPQHLTSVSAAAAVSSAAVQGADISSTSLQFRPKALQPGKFYFDVGAIKGSAGSAPLILQTIVLPLSFAEQESTIEVVGGTHVPWSPSFHYLNAVFAPLLKNLGLSATFAISSWGWYPGGGGRVSARIKPAQGNKPLHLNDRGKLIRVKGISAVSNLPEHIAARQRERALLILGRNGIDASIDICSAPSAGKGSFLFLCAEFEHIAAGFSALGAIGKRAEQVADEACEALMSFVQSEGALDPHLADQILPYLAFSSDASEFTTSCISRHLLTNIWVVKQFLNLNVRIEGNEGEPGRIIVRHL